MSELPKGWAWATLNELLTGIEAGKSFKCEERPPEPDEVGVVKVSAVTWGASIDDESKTCLDADRVNPALFIRDGDFLFSRANTIDLVGACVVAGGVTRRVMLSDKILRFRFADDRLKPWVLRYLRSRAGRQQIEALSTGNQESMRNIGQERIGQIAVPLPPRQERQRISLKMDELFVELETGISELKAAQTKLQRYRQSLLQAAVQGDLTADWRDSTAPTETGAELLQRILAERRVRWEAAQRAKAAAAGKALAKGWQAKYEAPQPAANADASTVPDGWGFASLGQLLAVLTSGSRDWAPFYDKGECVFVMAQNVRPWRPDFSFRQLVDPPPDHRDRQRSQIAKDDLLLTIVGANTGQACRVAQQLDSHFVCQSVALLRLVEPALAEYINAVLNSEGHGQRQFKEMNYGAGRPHLSFEQIESVLVPLPPIAEAEAIVMVLESAFAELIAVETSISRGLAQAAAQRQNILRAAFAGQLVPQDPADEPAEVLLARLRGGREGTKAPARKRAARAAAGA